MVRPSRLVTVTLLFSLICISARGQTAEAGRPPTSKQPWQWTTEERIAKRTNADLARERVRAHAGGRIATVASADVEQRPMADVFNGRSHPELFLPYQVFKELVTLAFLTSPRTREVVRDGLMPKIQQHGLPPDFWERLQSVSAIYIAESWNLRDLEISLQHQEASGRPRLEEAIARAHADVCRTRAESLAAAQAEFGSERFTRFLYEVVAVNMFSATDRLPDPMVLRQAEGGCR